MFHTCFNIMHQQFICAVHDLIHSKGRGRKIGLLVLMPGKRILDFNQPFIEQFGRPGVKRGK